MTNKQRVLLAVTSAVIVSGGVLVQGALAQSDTSVHSLVQEIADKFNLKQSDVQAVFDQHKQEVQAAKQQKVSDRLSQAVTDGSLTAAQKDLILAKQKEIQDKLNTIRSVTDQTERRKEMNQLWTDTQAWAKQNNISLSWLKPFPGRGPGKMHRMMHN